MMTIMIMMMTMYRDGVSGRCMSMVYDKDDDADDDVRECCMRTMYEHGVWRCCLKIMGDDDGG